MWHILLQPVWHVSSQSSRQHASPQSSRQHASRPLLKGHALPRCARLPATTPHPALTQPSDPSPSQDCLLDFLRLMGDQDRHVRKAAVVSLSAAVLHKQGLVAAGLLDLLPLLYDQTVVKQEMVTACARARVHVCFNVFIVCTCNRGCARSLATHASFARERHREPT
jgi:hypothetical protein